jgi:hypothetical protein
LFEDVTSISTALVNGLESTLLGFDAVVTLSPAARTKGLADAELGLNTRADIRKATVKMIFFRTSSPDRLGNKLD